MSNTGSACAITRARGSYKELDNNPDRIRIWKCWFLRRGERRSTQRKTSRSKEKNQQQTRPPCDAGSGNRTQDTLLGGERSHHFAIPAPPGSNSGYTQILDIKSYILNLGITWLYPKFVYNVATVEFRYNVAIPRIWV